MLGGWVFLMSEVPLWQTLRARIKKKFEGAADSLSTRIFALQVNLVHFGNSVHFCKSGRASLKVNFCRSTFRVVFKFSTLDSGPLTPNPGL